MAGLKIFCEDLRELQAGAGVVVVRLAVEVDALAPNHTLQGMCFFA